LFRSPKFGDGMTSEATEESGMNDTAAAPAVADDGARCRFAADLSGESGGMERLETGGAQAIVDSNMGCHSSFALLRHD
jgi:hypothetical protein